MEVFLIKSAQVLLSLSILVILHELGHFIPARLFKTRVERFFLFFDVKFALIKKKVGNTIYGIGWLPLGGYVKIAGMVDESMDTEQLKKPPQPWEFRSKPAWQRLIIMAGGVLVNVLIALIIYIIVLFSWGKEVLPNENLPDGFAPSETAKELGFQFGDKVIAVNEKPLENVWNINKYLFLRSVKTISIERKNGTKEKLLIPKNIGKKMFQKGDIPVLSPILPVVVDSITKNSVAEKAALKKGDRILSFGGEKIKNIRHFRTLFKGNLNKENPTEIVFARKDSIHSVLTDFKKDSILGSFFDTSFYENLYETKKMTLGNSLKEGFSYSYWTLHDYVAQFKYVFTKKGATSLGGFGAIGQLFPASWDWRAFWETTALISIILAFMNILPIPALDGGHILFLLYEIFTRRQPSQKFLEYAQMIGFVLLISLFLYANGNDVYRAFFS